MIQWKKNLYISWFTQILSLTGFGFMMPFLPLYIQELGITAPKELRLWTGLISAAPSICLAVMAPIWGMLSDRWGRKIMILRAMAAATVVVGLMGLAGNVETVLILRIAQGLFTGTVTASATLVAAGTPSNKLSYALGFLSSSTFIGFSFGPLLGGLCAEFFGYRTTFFIGGSIIFIGFLLVLFFIREVKTADEAPSEEGEKFSLKSLLVSSFAMLFLLVLLVRFSRMLPNPFMPLFIQELRGRIEGTAAVTGFIAAAVGLVTAASVLTLVRLGDRHERIPLIALFLGLAALAALPIYFTRRLLWFVPVYLASVYLAGAAGPLLQSHLSASVPPQYRGILIGLQTAAGSLGWFLAPLVSSAIAIYLSIKHIFLFFSLALFITFLLTMAYHRKTVSRRACQRNHLRNQMEKLSGRKAGSDI